ncbi:hypothetical protein F5Y17DRAFT_354418 [Xylariaceae sp. FL0594]|nr:hypothetical protein F5Y17DRAFT_354418 [Xylariaceae sp. FL0594]
MSLLFSHRCGAGAVYCACVIQGGFCSYSHIGIFFETPLTLSWDRCAGGMYVCMVGMHMPARLRLGFPNHAVKLFELTGNVYASHEVTPSQSAGCLCNWLARSGAKKKLRRMANRIFSFVFNSGVFLVESVSAKSEIRHFRGEGGMALHENDAKPSPVTTRMPSLDAVN